MTTTDRPLAAEEVIRMLDLVPHDGRCAMSWRVCGLAALLLLAAFAAQASARISSPDGGVAFYGHVFPVQGPHGTRGAIGEFGAPRDGGRTHEGFDITAACGTELVAVRDGMVLRTGYDPVLYGNYLLIHGEGEDRSYFYAHMPRPALVHRGERVWEGERVGSVGETGNARGLGPVACSGDHHDPAHVPGVDCRGHLHDAGRSEDPGASHEADRRKPGGVEALPAEHGRLDLGNVAGGLQ